jgi:hypothetical protein
MKSDQYKKVFEGSAIDANLIKDILAGEGISTIIKEDMLSQIFPMFVASGDLKPLKVYVDKIYSAQASQIIEEYFENYKNNPEKS